MMLLGMGGWLFRWGRRFFLGFDIDFVSWEKFRILSSRVSLTWFIRSSDISAMSDTFTFILLQITTNQPQHIKLIKTIQNLTN